MTMAKLIIWMLTFFITICCLNSQINASDNCDGDKFFKCNNERCVSRSMTCNNVNDCGDNSDEFENDVCPDKKMTVLYDKGSCEMEDNFYCTNNNCIPNEKVCNRVDDCFDGSDEYANCTQHKKCKSSQFTCKNKYCIPSGWVCDKENDCGDNSDEECDPRKNNPCATGNVFNNNSQTCEDVDECSGTYHIQVCDHICTNSDGSYLCSCYDGYLLDSDGKTCVINNHHIEPLLIFSTNTEIKEYHLKTNLYYPSVANIFGATAIAQSDNYTYWSDNTNIYRIKKSNDKNDLSTKSMNKSEIVVKFGAGQIHDIEIDWITGNIYFTDNLNHRITVCTANGSYCTIINDNNHVSKINGLALYPLEKNMYWIEGGHKCSIYRSKMDGRYPQAIVKKNLTNVRNLVVDYPAKRIYWTNDYDYKKRAIESSDLDGNNRRIIVDNFPMDTSIVYVFEDNLYWYNTHFKTIEYCKKLHCKIRKTLVNAKNTITDISIYHPIIKTDVNNPCLKKSCSELCLLSNNEATCACSFGKKLSNDRITCRGHQFNDKYLMISAGSKLMSFDQNKELSEPKITINYSYKKISSMVYDLYNEQLIITDGFDNTLTKYKLKTRQVFKILSFEPDEMINSMSYDYYGNNLYTTNFDSDTIEIYNLMNLNTTTINIGFQPINIIVIPEKAIMFVAYIFMNTDDTIRIDKMSMMGDKIMTIKDNIYGKKLPMTTDGNTLFYASRNKIYKVNITTDVIKLYIEESDNISSLAILNDELFWSMKKTIFWSNKNVELPEEVYHKLFDENVDSLLMTTIKNTLSDKLHNCHSNNGGCSHVCLVESSTENTCACSNDMILLRDQKTCVERTKDNFEPVDICPEYTCDNGQCIDHQDNCNQKNDCSDGSDEGVFCFLKCSILLQSVCDHYCQETPKGPQCFCFVDHTLIDGRYCHRIDHCLTANCSHLCQPHGNTYSCSCYLGYKLNKDGITCDPINSTQLPIMQNQSDIHEINVDSRKIEIITPPHNESKIFGLDYDSVRGYVYFSNFNNIIQMDIKNNSRKVLENISQASVISVDWVTGNIFFVDQNISTPSIIVANMNNNNNITRKTIVNIKKKSLYGEKITSLVVVPKNGLLFWSQINIDRFIYSEIYKSNMTGDGVESIIKHDTKYITSIAVDHIHDWIYWFDTEDHLISRCKFDGKEREPFKVKFNIKETGVTIFDNAIYWIASGQSNIKRCLLFGHRACETIPITGIISNFAVLSPVSKQIIGNNYCENTKCNFMCVLNGSQSYACIEDNDSTFDTKIVTTTDDEIDPENDIAKMDKNDKNSTDSTSSMALILIILILCVLFLIIGIIYLYCTKYNNSLSTIVLFRNNGTDNIEFENSVEECIPSSSDDQESYDFRQSFNQFEESSTDDSIELKPLRCFSSSAHDSDVAETSFNDNNNYEA